MSEKNNLYIACKAAYLLVLQMPHNALRARNQATLCLLRDAIAEHEKRNREQVQDEYEDRAFLERLATR